VAVKLILLPVVVGNMSELAPLTLHSMHTYASYGDEVNGEVDSVSVDILKKFQPVVLEDVYPARVAADGTLLLCNLLIAYTADLNLKFYFNLYID
jgi:hypothetical protein